MPNGEELTQDYAREKKLLRSHGYGCVERPWHGRGEDEEDNDLLCTVGTEGRSFQDNVTIHKATDEDLVDIEVSRSHFTEEQGIPEVSNKFWKDVVPFPLRTIMVPERGFDLELSTPAKHRGTAAHNRTVDVLEKLLEKKVIHSKKRG